MTRDGHVRAIIGSEDAIEDPLRPNILIRTRLAMQRHPQLIILRKVRLDPIIREQIPNIRRAAAPIARVAADAFAEKLLDQGHEGVPGGQIQAVEGVVGCLEAPGQGTGVVALRGGDFLSCYLGCPEVVDGEGLGDAEGGEVGVGPGHCAVAV